MLTSILLAGQACGESPATVSAADDPFASAIELAQKRTVKIFGASIGRTAGYATGLIVSKDGQIVTAQGSFLATQNLRVTLADGSTHQAKVLRRSQPLQVALLKVDVETPDYFDLGRLPKVEAGDWVLTVSNAFKVADGPEPLSVNLGVLGLRTPLEARRGFQDFPYEGDVYLYDAITSNPGAAGGAVVAADGNLVGMIGKVIESKSTNTRLNYAVPADLLAQFVSGNELASPTPPVAPATAAAPELGIRLFALGGRNSPAYIDRVLPNSPAAGADLQSDDLIISVGGQVVHNGADFRRIVGKLKPGEKVVVEVKRKNEVLSVTLTVAEGS